MNVFCREWERFVRKEDIQREGYVPCIVEKYGVERRLAIKRDLLEEIAFDEEQGHLSYRKPLLSFPRFSLVSSTRVPLIPRTEDPRQSPFQRGVSLFGHSLVRGFSLSLLRLGVCFFTWVFGRP